MKLGDVLPHWIFRERAGVDLEVGGSAFAHLAEDVGSGGVVADWPISAPVFLSQDDNTNTTTSASLAPGALALWKRDDLGGTRAIGVGLWSDNEYRTLIHGDGSLHWGDGTAAPDVSLGRLDAGALEMKGLADPSSYVAFDANNGMLDLYDNSTGGQIEAKANSGLVQIWNNGGGLRLTSPDGNQTRTIRLSNAGAVEVVA